MSSALATTRTVNTTADDQNNGCTTDPGGCTLREAIAASLDNESIDFAPSLNGAGIGLNGTELGIARNLTINGPSGGVTIDAGFLSRIFNVHAGTVTLSNLTIAGGQVKGVHGADAFNVTAAAQPGGDEYGGGIRNAGTLTLTNCRVTDNRVSGGRGGKGYLCNCSNSSVGREGGAGWGGGIANFGSLTLINCTVSGNYAFGGAGGISYDLDGTPSDRSGAGGFAYGGGIFSSQSGKTLIMTGCTFSGNVASGGPGADGGRWAFGGHGGSAIGGGLYSNAPTTTLKLCTMSDNEAEGGPGGVEGPYAFGFGGDDGRGGSGYGGGIYTSSALTLLSCTVSDNLGRGGLAGGAHANNGSVEGGGLYGLGCTIRNTIIARNSIESTGASGPDVQGDQSSEGHNFIGNTGDNGDGSVSSGWVATDLKGSIGSALDPGLGPLQDNGGPTFTRALLSTSAAIDKGDDAVLSAPFNLNTDQRGFPRQLGAHVDIGAFEFTGNPTPTPTPTATPDVTPTPTPDVTPTPTPDVTVTPTPVPITGSLGNISTRLLVETGDNVLIGGFIVTGVQDKKVIIRAIGPSLQTNGEPVPGRLENPTLELYSGQTLLASNDNWIDSPDKQAIIDSTIPPNNDLEAAIVATLPADNSAYTAIVRGVGETTGVGLIEVYDLDQTVDSKLANISTRGLVQTGANVMIGGFIVLGQNAQRVIIRAIGPSLPVPGALADPTLDIYDGNGVLLAQNDNWRSDQEADIIATTVPPTNDLESAIVGSASPGNYTAIVRGVSDSTGVALVEVYALP